MDKVVYQGSTYEVLHKTSLTTLMRHFNDSHIRYEYLVACGDTLFLADIIDGSVRLLTRIGATAQKSTRYLRDAQTHDYIVRYALKRERLQKLHLLLDET